MNNERFYYSNNTESMFDSVQTKFIFWRAVDRRFWYVETPPYDLFYVMDDFGNLVPVVY